MALANQLELVKQAKGEESAEYKRLNNQIILNEAARLRKEREQKEDLRQFERQLAVGAATLLKEGLALVEDNLNKKTAAYQIFKAARKTAELAEIGMGVIAETQANALNAARHPTNALPGGAALVATQLAIQNGLAIARGIGAAIKVAAFKEGGNTGRATDVFSIGQLGSVLSGASGGSFAGGGPIGKPTIGLIGEAGPELVIPNWLYADPKQADLMGFLEASIASKGRAFVDRGSTVPGVSMGKAAASGDDTVTGLLGQMVQVMGQLNGRLEGVEDWQRNLAVQNNLQEVERGLKVIQETQSGGGIRKTR